MAPTIVVSDDEDAIRTVLANDLSLAGFKSVPFLCKKGAFDWILENQPDLVISDIKSAGMDGYQLLRWIKANPFTCHIPVIFVTGFADLRNAIYSKELGVADFVSKPFDIDDLIKTVERVLAEEGGQGPLPQPPALVEAARAGQLVFRPWDELHHAAQSSMALLGVGRCLLSCSEPWTMDYLLDYSRSLSVCRIMRPTRVDGVSAEELLSFRELLDKLGLAHGFLFSLAGKSDCTNDIAPLLGIIVHDQPETASMLESGVHGHPSDLLQNVVNGALLQAWEKEHQGLRAFAARILETMAAHVGTLHCSFMEKEKLIRAVMVLRDVGPRKLVFEDSERRQTFEIGMPKILHAIAVLWQRGQVTLVSDRRLMHDVVLSTFLASLPHLEGDGRTVYRKDANAEICVREFPLVALLDDDESLLDRLGQMLRNAGYEVITFTYKDEFLCYIKHHPHAVPDLVVSDMTSPRMDGFEFLEQFRSDPQRGRVPVIIVSGKTPLRKRRVLRLGAYRCLDKPCEDSKLLELINRILWKRGIRAKLGKLCRRMEEKVGLD